MRTVGIVQARMASERLPGKVMMDVDGVPMLGRVLERARRSGVLDDLWIATSTAPEDDAIAAFADRFAVPVHRGPLHDVLGRYVEAATVAHADIVVRLTGDNPLLEPTYVQMAVDLHRSADVDVTCARDPEEIVPGTGCEVVTVEALCRAADEGHAPEDREHVTWYLLANRHRFGIRFLTAAPGWENPGIRLAVDESEDLVLVREIYARLAPGNGAFGLGQVLQLHRREPELFLRNAAVRARPSLFHRSMANETTTPREARR